MEALIAAAIENADEDVDVVDRLFSRAESRRAASAFLTWFVANGGRATQKEMSEFSRGLASGSVGARLSRANFYGSILKRLIALGLVSVGPVYDERRRRAVKGYLAVLQAVPQRRPPAGSLVYLVHRFAERWNQLLETHP